MKRAARALSWACASAILLAPAGGSATLIVEPAPERSQIEAIAGALSAEISRALPAHARGRLVLRTRIEIADAARSDALASMLGAPAREAIAADTARFPEVHTARFEGDEAAAAERAARLGYAIFVDIRVRAAGHFVEALGSVWDAPGRAQLASFDLRSRFDAELRTYFGALDRTTEDTVVARSVALPSRDYLAMAARDLDGDGTSELVLATARTIEILRLAAGRVGVRFETIAILPIPPDIAAAPWHPRRALGSAVALDRAVVVRVAHRAAPIRVEMADDGPRAARAQGPCADDTFPIDAGCAHLVLGRDFFDETLSRSDGTEHRAAGHFYAHAFARIRGGDGSVLAYEAMVNPHGRLSVRVGERTVGAVGYGTALAMADLDQDGTAELLASNPGPEGSGDQISILRALSRGALHVVWRGEPVEGSIWIAQRGDLDGDGLDELLAIEEPLAQGTARLWIVR